MNRYLRTDLGDAPLLAQLGINACNDRQNNADLIADIGEVDERKLYLPAAYPSMYAFLTGEHHMSEDVACKRITVAKKAREFPGIFEAIADGRLHLSGVVMLAPHLKMESAEAAEALLAAAAHKSKNGIQQLVRRHLPGPEQSPPPGPAESHSSSAMPESDPLSRGESGFELSAPGRIDMHASSSSAPTQRHGQLNLDEETEVMLEYAGSLLGHQVAPGDLSKLLRRLLELSIPLLERKKFGASARPRGGRTCSNHPRHIPTHVKCVVWKRDGGQCTFVSESGKRCPGRTPLEFDHIVEVALGGAASVENIRLRCRAHNQFTAEQTFGAGFMQQKRLGARRTASEKRATVKAKSSASAASSEHPSEERDVTPWLRALGYSVDQVRRAVDQ